MAAMPHNESGLRESDNPFLDPATNTTRTSSSYIDHYVAHAATLPSHTPFDTQTQTIPQSSPPSIYNYPPSVYSTASTMLPSYHSATARWGPHTRYPTESAYLDALRAWAKEKEYMEPVDGMGRPTRLIGFYGSKTSEDIIREGGEGGGVDWGLLSRRGRRERREKKARVVEEVDGSSEIGDRLREEEGAGIGDSIDEDEAGDEEDYGQPGILERAMTVPAPRPLHAVTRSGVGSDSGGLLSPGRRRSSLSGWLRRKGKTATTGG